MTAADFSGSQAEDFVLVHWLRDSMNAVEYCNAAQW